MKLSPTFKRLSQIVSHTFLSKCGSQRSTILELILKLILQIIIITKDNDNDNDNDDEQLMALVYTVARLFP